MKKDARHPKRLREKPAFYLDGPCPSWCQPNCHGDGLSGEDRNHTGRDRKVKFVTMDACTDLAHAVGDYWPANAHLWLTQGIRETAARLVMETEVWHWNAPGKAPEVRHQMLEMTIQEARKLARCINEACDTAVDAGSNHDIVRGVRANWAAFEDRKNRP